MATLSALDSARASSRGVERMQRDHQSLNEGIGSVDVGVALSHHQIVFQTDAPDSGLPSVGLKVELHPRSEDERILLGMGAEIRRFPGRHTRAVAERVE